MRLCATLLGLLTFGCAHQAHELRHGGHGAHRFEDAEAWAVRFEDPKRDEWQRPNEVLRVLALPQDAKVADIGAATGYFPVRIARAVPQGRVYGVDIESSMVAYLTNRAAAEGLSNLTAVLGTASEAKIPEPVDLIIMVNTYHHIEDRPQYFARLAGSLKPRGRLAIIDFTKASRMGPPAEFKVDPQQVVSELGQAGFTELSRHTLPEQFFLVFGR